MQFDLNDPKHLHADTRLRREPIIWMSSVRPDGRPHLIPVWFLWDGATILIFSQPKTQKMRNLRASPHVTLALEAANTGSDIVILDGTIAIGALDAVKHALPAYAEKYGALIAGMNWTLETMLADYSVPLIVTPTRLTVWS